ncbi:hypothetical protein GIB67_017439 [Kingdonia uniflora]|uniref:Protein kinase domain-containing protein n=1 Tax=Kingdonia uniflora TaxID=39325 RepID=A0A7J7M4C7_9MAGN|nr:hypothetical protein GIB67_017439 [Kingdonia uniflora]
MFLKQFLFSVVNTKSQVGIIIGILPSLICWEIYRARCKKRYEDIIMQADLIINKVNSEAKKYKIAPLQHRDLLEKLFDGLSATGDFAWSLVPLAGVDYPWDGEAIPSYDSPISPIREPTPGSTSRSRTPAPQSSRRRSAAAVQPLEPMELVLQEMVSSYEIDNALFFKSLKFLGGSNEHTYRLMFIRLRPEQRGFSSSNMYLPSSSMLFSTKELPLPLRIHKRYKDSLRRTLNDLPLHLVFVSRVSLQKYNNSKATKLVEEIQHKDLNMLGSGGAMVRASKVNGLEVIEAGFVRKIHYEELQTATTNFSDKLGSGGPGQVFKGILKCGTSVAVKRLEREIYGEQEFLSELIATSSVQHFNVIHVHRYCSHVSETSRFYYIVYELFKNGSLDSWIFPRKDCPNGRFLNWKKRCKVAVDVAKALVYLHRDCGASGLAGTWGSNLPYKIGRSLKGFDGGGGEKSEVAGTNRLSKTGHHLCNTL